MKIKERYQYNADDKLGEGGFASVYKAWDKNLDHWVALKFYNKKDVHGDKTLVNEIRIAIKQFHPNLVRYYDVQTEHYNDIHGGTQEVQIGIMEYMDEGELHTYIERHPQHLKKLLVDVLEGLKYLHNHNLIHRDLKPSNILVKNTKDGPVAKIADFGISKDLDATVKSSSKLMGTLKYMAPEQFDPAMYGENKRISTNVDLWSFGLIVYELIKKTPLIDHNDLWTFSEIVRSIEKKIPEDRIQTLESPYREVVAQCMVHHATKRVKLSQDLIDILLDDSLKIVAKGDYSEGLAWAKFSNGLYGFVDHQNHIVIKPKYDLANNFVNGTALVLYNSSWISIDRYGNHITGGSRKDSKGGSFISRNKAFVIVMSLVILSFFYFLYDVNNPTEYTYEEETTAYLEEDLVDSTAAADSYYYDETMAADSTVAY